MIRMRSDIVALLILLAGAASGARGQTPAAVRLRIHPRVGDSLRTRFEQDMDMTATTQVHGKDTTLVTRTSTLVIARLVVVRADSAGAVLEAITDSVAVLTVGEQAITPSEGARRAMQRRRIALHVRADGAVRIDAPSDLDRDLGALVGTMPATLPADPVRVGESWESVVAVPVGGEAGDGRGARLRAEYKFDSSTVIPARDYIEVRGVIARDSTGGALRDGTRMTSAGTMTGAVVLDRARGWWDDSKIVITINSVITPAVSAGGPPVHVRTRITERVQTEELRPLSAPPG
jgi:hypothetical protein